jgi:hypothetical protein
MGHKIIHIGRSFRHLISGERTPHKKNENQHSNVKSLLQNFNSNKLAAAKLYSYHQTISWWKKLSGLTDFSGKYRQFSVPTQHENLDVSANGTQRLQYCPACWFTTVD